MKFENRRSFLKKVGATAAGSLIAPHILPSGSLFKATTPPLSSHVVLVLFAGGVRHQESVGKRYLDDSQGLPYDGNIMYNMLSGSSPTAKIVYGTGNGGLTPIPQLLTQSLQAQGTLFSEVNSASVGHYTGLNALIQGNDAVTQGLKQKPINPTIFEYVRKHRGDAASKVWFIGDSLSNSTALLNYSIDPNYGASYGANFFCPNVTFGNVGQNAFEDAKIYHPENEMSPMYQMKYFLDNSFENIGNSLPNIGNTEEEKHDIKQFMKHMYDKTAAGTINHPPVANGDGRTIGYTCELLSWFKPTLTVIKLSSVDGCHSNFTGYLRNLHRADHAVGHLWDHIQSIPGMAGDTSIICTPECGRNLNPNGILDVENEFKSYDHSDANARRVFSLMAGPNIPQNLSIGSESNPIGLTFDMVPTVGEILGIKNDIISAGHLGGGAQSLFDRI